MPSTSRKTKDKASFNVPSWAQGNDGFHTEYSTNLGAAIVGRSEEVVRSRAGRALKNRVQLVFTSPPFPLNRKKRYGNHEGNEFKAWLRGYARLLSRLLTDDGSIVIEMGNAWEAGAPVMSTLALESLLEFKQAGKLHLCQEFIWFNSARLPSPAQWVTIDRVRVKDAFTRLWWLSPTEHPKADNRRVLSPYSGSMKTLLRTKSYNSGVRPSEHVIGAKSFLRDNGGAIPPNVLDFEGEVPSNLLVGGNTSGTDPYNEFCRSRGLVPHPARMPIGLAKFFINLCTTEGDLVLDPFGGSNTTGAAAEELNRKWVSIEAQRDYAVTGRGRFPSLAAEVPRLPNHHVKAVAG